MKSKHLQFHKLAFFLCLLFSLFSAFKSSVAQVNSAATSKTKALYANLKKVQQSNQFLFGQEFFNSYRFSLANPHKEKEYSDSKVVTGAHPAVLGSDFHYYLEKSEKEMQLQTEAVKWAYQQGHVITFDWHISGRGTTSYEYRNSNKELVNDIVNDKNGARTWYLSELDKAINIVNNLLVVDKERIPIVFRPLHEMNGGWFWWGSQSSTPDIYIQLFRLTVNYFKERTTSVLFCWSPNTPVDMNYYPGDEYVDILGVDIYEATISILRADLGKIVDKAESAGKVAVIAETGNRTKNVDEAVQYWKDVILPAVINDPSGKSQKIAWVLAWINASWSFSYVPDASSSNAAKQSFIDFKNSPEVMFGDELPDMYKESIELSSQP